MHRLSEVPPTIAELRARVLDGTLKPSEIAAAAIARADEGDPRIWISRRTAAEIMSEARGLDARDPRDYPLLGIPFAVKDNIDVAGLPTTAACPDFSYRPSKDATAVALLRAAGAIVIGKTNLDQFATGLVGVRSPYGVPRNAIDPDFIPGGSSSGSAVTVALGQVPFALGTDTAGSGRVPAAFNNIVGWKPTRGLVSNTGLVPACRTLDCISVFAMTAGDCATVADVVAAYDPVDPFSRRAPAGSGGAVDWPGLKVGVPRNEDLDFFGDDDSAALYDAAVERVAALGAEIVRFDFGPFLETARLLYEGPWVGERYLAVRDLLERSPGSLHPVTLKIVEGGARPRAIDLFAAEYRLMELRRTAAEVFEKLDLLILPTAGTIYRLSELEAEPITLNSNLGRYTNFMNLLDLSGVALPAGFRGDRLPFGVTLAAPAFRDRDLLALADRLHRLDAPTLGATGWPIPEAGTVTVAPEGIEIAVCGAHMSGLPLNGELRRLGGVLDRRARTADCYRFYALRGAKPARPGLVRTAKGAGHAIDVEVWRLPPSGIAALLQNIPGPLALGTVSLSDGTTTKGFVCEAAGAADGEDISRFGGWRQYLAAAATG
ncbi:MAG: allophanate hydrolase [Pseudomonadota bacterium]|nr:allophanate hydrolase [Pseudomonadota bacterium]